MKRKILLTTTLLAILSLCGCSGQQPAGGGGFDIVKFLQNPFVMIIIALFIVYWMMKRK